MMCLRLIELLARKRIKKMSDKIRKQIKKIPGHWASKLNTYDLLFAAAEFEKYSISDLLEQIESIDLSEDQKTELRQNIASFESSSGISGNWAVSPSTVR